MDTREEIQKTLDKPAQQRDELIVQVQLAKLEAMDEWQNVESQLSQLRSMPGPSKGTAKEGVKDIQAGQGTLPCDIGHLLVRSA